MILNRPVHFGFASLCCKQHAKKQQLVQALATAAWRHAAAVKKTQQTTQLEVVQWVCYAN